MKVDWPREFPGVHWLDGQEDQAVLDVLHQGSLFRYYGPREPKYVRLLESTAREFYGTRHALAVNSGSGALITAMAERSIPISAASGGKNVLPRLVIQATGSPCFWASSTSRNTSVRVAPARSLDISPNRPAKVESFQPMPLSGVVRSRGKPRSTGLGLGSLVCREFE